MSQCPDCERRHSENERRLAILETKHENLANREWVHGVIEPIKDSVRKIETSITTLTGKMEGVFDTQDKLLREKAEGENKLLQAQIDAAKSQTLSAIIKEKWVPILTFVALFITVGVAFGGAFSWWILNHVLPHAAK